MRERLKILKIRCDFRNPDVIWVQKSALTSSYMVRPLFFPHSRHRQNLWKWSKIVPPIYINRIMIFFSKKKFVAICVPNEKSFWTAVFAIYSTFYPFWTWAGSFFSNPFHFPAKWRHREMVGSFLLRFCEKIEEKLENMTFRRPESHLTIPNCLPASK